MRGRKSSFVVSLRPDQRADLESMIRSTKLAAGLARRARLILLVAEGQNLTRAAAIVGLSVRNARKWVRRFLASGVDGLQDQAGRGRKPVFSPRSRSAPGQDRLRIAR
jgi:hypothetical protein